MSEQSRDENSMPKILDVRVNTDGSTYTFSLLYFSKAESSMVGGVHYYYPHSTRSNSLKLKIITH